MNDIDDMGRHTRAWEVWFSLCVQRCEAWKTTPLSSSRDMLHSYDHGKPEPGRDSTSTPEAWAAWLRWDATQDGLNGTQMLERIGMFFLIIES